MGKAVNPRVIMTADEYIRRLKVIANRQTFYKNKWPYNVGLNAPSKAQGTFKDCRGVTRQNLNPFSIGALSFDCSNLVKSILNGYDVNNNQVGYYQTDLSNTGDCSEIDLLNQCTGISNDFKNIKAPAIMYMDKPNRHIGTYIGITPDNRFNVIECTTSFGGGVIYSWVDQDGTRRSENGGKPIVMSDGTYNRWQKYGYPTLWVGNVQNQPISQEKPKEDKTYPILKKGSKGEAVRNLQAILTDKGFDPKGIDGDFGNNTQAAVKKFQESRFVTGVVDDATWKELLK